MKGKLDQKWVKQVATELEPIFKFMDHTWKTSLLPPTAAVIADEINSLWSDLKEEDSELGSGGIYVSVDEEDQPIVGYRKDIRFEFNHGEPFSV